MFVDVLRRDEWGIGVRPAVRKRPHTQLAVWSGRPYRGIILTFFESVPAARASRKALTWIKGGEQVRNVVAAWDFPGKPPKSSRQAVLGCLRPEGQVGGSPQPAPRATLATFAGRWGGHGRGLSISATGRGKERVNSGCCILAFQMTYRIISVSGTITHATARYRVTSFGQAGTGMNVHVGDTGRLRLKNGILTNVLTADFFCSNPAWGATGVCGL